MRLLIVGRISIFALSRAGMAHPGIERPKMFSSASGVTALSLAVSLPPGPLIPACPGTCQPVLARLPWYVAGRGDRPGAGGQGCYHLTLLVVRR